MSVLRKLAAGILPASLLFLAGCAGEADDPPVPEAFACQGGAWRTDRGQLVVVSPVSGGLRYRLLDGRSGMFPVAGKSPGDELTAREGWRSEGPTTVRAIFEPCETGRMHFELEDGSAAGIAVKLPLEIRDTRFRSDDLELRGRLVLPPRAKSPVPLAVLVHGSERWSAVDANFLQYMLPAQGVAVFVYDKRGTGGSDGEYTQDFHALAGDAIAALAEARRMAPGAFSHAGYVGGSQGGWIAPLAASRSEADYAVALYGLAESPLAEDREQVMDDLRARGHGEDVLAKARELTDATGLLVSSRFTRGFDELDAVRAKYGDEPWFADARGEYTGDILGYPAWMPRWLARMIAGRYDVGTSWDYDPMQVLAALEVPQLWVVADRDLEAPPQETLRRIRELQAQGRPIDLAVFPGTDHGIYLFEEQDGKRVNLRNPAGYHTLLSRWVSSLSLRERHGDALLEPRRGGAATAAGDDTETQ